MTHYEDLQPIDYFGQEAAEHLVAVGWLCAGQTFRTGAVSKGFYDRRKDLMAHRYEPRIPAGPQSCDLCQFDGPSASGNLFVPDAHRMFVVPELVLHYIAAHRYQPPDAFVDAAMRCPMPSGMDYRRQFLAAGGRKLLS